MIIYYREARVQIIDDWWRRGRRYLKDQAVDFK